MLKVNSPVSFSALSLVLGLSMVRADAATAAGQNDPFHLIQENHHYYELNLTALAMQPSATNLNYVIYNKALPIQSPSWTEEEIEPGYSAGFTLGGRYFLAEGRDISLDWSHLFNTSHASVTAPNDQYFLGPDYEIGPEAGIIRDASGKAEFKVDVVNLSARQALNISRHLSIHLLGGVSNAYLREQVNATYSGIVDTGLYQGPFQQQQMVTANFTGIGPRLGMDVDYHCDAGVGLFGEAGISALIGSAYAKTAYHSSSQELLQVFGQTNNYQTIRDKSVSQVVPGFDVKLGLSYQQAMQNGMTLTLVGGYQAMVYVNAINQYLPGSIVSNTNMGTGGIFVATVNHTLSNYNLQGPFLKAEFALA